MAIKFVKDGDHFLAVHDVYGLSGRGKSYLEAAKNLAKYVDEMKEDQEHPDKDGYSHE